MRKNIIILLVMMLFISLKTFANDIDTVKLYFNDYVSAANTYNSKIFSYYYDDAKIIRQVIKPDGTTVNATTDMKTYKKQMRIGQSLAKIRGYQNTYTNITATILPNGDVKISALRQPQNDDDKLNIYQIWRKQINNSWVIIEEMMQTRQQIFLKYAD